MEGIMERPIHDKAMGHSRRALTRLWRRQSAWDMAHYISDEVSEEQFEKAYDLLNRCTRWAIAQMRFDESETAENHDSPYRKHQEELLDRRYDKLQAELREYGCTINCGGYFCQNVNRYDFERHVITDNNLLHFFD